MTLSWRTGCHSLLYGFILALEVLSTSQVTGDMVTITSSVPELCFQIIGSFYKKVFFLPFGYKILSTHHFILSDKWVNGVIICVWIPEKWRVLCGHSDLWPTTTKINQFIFESKWMFVPNFRKFLPHQHDNWGRAERKPQNSWFIFIWNHHLR